MGITDGIEGLLDAMEALQGKHNESRESEARSSSIDSEKVASETSEWAFAKAKSVIELLDIPPSKHAKAQSMIVELMEQAFARGVTEASKVTT